VIAAASREGLETAAGGTAPAGWPAPEPCPNMGSTTLASREGKSNARRASRTKVATSTSDRVCSAWPTRAW
jgi:hypothetical protein